ncbi:hypothetical protein M8494_36150 [Serratia ureilytica]
MDVDTAAARLKSHYQFISSEELESLRQRDQHGNWSASSIDEARPVWSANQAVITRWGRNGKAMIDLNSKWSSLAQAAA